MVGNVDNERNGKERNGRTVMMEAKKKDGSEDTQGRIVGRNAGGKEREERKRTRVSGGRETRTANYDWKDSRSVDESTAGRRNWPG